MFIRAHHFFILVLMILCDPSETIRRVSFGLTLLQETTWMMIGPPPNSKDARLDFNLSIISLVSGFYSGLLSAFLFGPEDCSDERPAPSPARLMDVTETASLLN